jgi:hypothetical protein
MSGASGLVEPPDDDLCESDDDAELDFDFDPIDVDEESGQPPRQRFERTRWLDEGDTHERDGSGYFDPVVWIDERCAHRPSLSAMLSQLQARHQSVYTPIERALKLFTTHKIDGVRREHDFVKKLGSVQNVMSILEQCPVWGAGMMDVLDGAAVENVMDRMAADNAVRWGTRIPLTKKEAERFAASDNGQKLAESAVLMRRETRREPLSSTETDDEARAIVQRLSTTVARDSRVTGLNYAWDFMVPDGSRMRYVGQSVGLTRPLQHVNRIEEAHRAKNSGKQYQYAHATVGEIANTQLRGLPDGTSAERYARCEKLISSDIWRLVTPGLLLKDSTRRALKVFFTLADAKTRPKGMFLTAEDAVRVFGLIKWLREVFETIVFRTGEWESELGLNRSPPGVPYRWMPWRHDSFVRNVTVERMREFLKPLSAHDLEQLGICVSVDELTGDALFAAFMCIYIRKSSRKHALINSMVMGTEGEDAKRQRREELNRLDFAAVDEEYKKYHQQRVKAATETFQARLSESDAAALGPGKSRKRSREERREEEKFASLRLG